MSKILVNVVLLTFLIGCTFAECPPESITRPCTCEPAGGLTLLCENVVSDDVLKGVFRRIRGLKFNNFELDESRIEFIPSDGVIQSRVNNIQLIRTNLTSLFQNPIDESNGVLTLSLDHVRFRNAFPWTQLQKLRKLKYLLVKDSDIPELGGNLKQNVNKDLQVLMLSGTNTRQLADGCLAEHKKLIDFRLENGKLKTLTRNIFPRPASALKILVFNGNQIETLPKNMFSDMPKLNLIGMKDNKLSIVYYQETFGVIPHLETLYLKGNPLNCNCEMRWFVSHKPTRYVDGVCQAPANLKDKEITKLKESHFGSC
ncbi:uncharacterized protein CDAR_89601 [Caerostris darwini]|uniref:Uncharacterized protein n=1 Tax=Caerostris darwini TaxID=1538125 RepID=A0AAV4VSC1_9ARAC|nr:uncharacterized protein CDAR_89601 [Caerostris darwini]